jgi:hypothetical protein
MTGQVYNHFCLHCRVTADVLILNRQRIANECISYVLFLCQMEHVTDSCRCLIIQGVYNEDRICSLVIRFPGYRSRGPGLIPGSIRFSEK